MSDLPEPLRADLDRLEWMMREARAEQEHLASLNPVLARALAPVGADFDQIIAQVNAAQDGDEDALNGL